MKKIIISGVICTVAFVASAFFVNFLNGSKVDLSNMFSSDVEALSTDDTNYVHGEKPHEETKEVGDWSASLEASLETTVEVTKPDGSVEIQTVCNYFVFIYDCRGAIFDYKVCNHAQVGTWLINTTSGVWSRLA